MVDFTLVKSAALSAPDLSVLPRIGEKFEEWLEAFLAGGLGGRKKISIFAAPKFGRFKIKPYLCPPK